MATHATAANVTTTAPNAIGQVSGIGVAWMLTPDDGCSDGGKTGYVKHPEQWRGSDPVLFRFLVRAVTKGSTRNLATFENAGLIPQALYHSELLGDSLADRAAYMESMLTKFKGLDLVFFDPDNGLEVKSRPMGRKGSSKFLGMAEVTEVFKTGMSLLIFQHFGRVKRDVYIPAQMERLGLATGAAKIISLATSNVLYLFVLQWDHTPEVRYALRVLSERWPGQFREASMTATSGLVWKVYECPRRLPASQGP